MKRVITEGAICINRMYSEVSSLDVRDLSVVVTLRLLQKSMLDIGHDEAQIELEGDEGLCLLAAVAPLLLTDRERE